MTSKVTLRDFPTLNDLDRAVEKDYRGKWIARDGKRLVAVGETLESVIEQAHKEKVSEPVVRRIPTRKPHFCLF